MLAFSWDQKECRRRPPGYNRGPARKEPWPGPSRGPSRFHIVPSTLSSSDARRECPTLTFAARGTRRYPIVLPTATSLSRVPPLSAPLISRQNDKMVWEWAVERYDTVPTLAEFDKAHKARSRPFGLRHRLRADRISHARWANGKQTGCGYILAHRREVRLSLTAELQAQPPPKNARLRLPSRTVADEGSAARSFMRRATARRRALGALLEPLSDRWETAGRRGSGQVATAPRMRPGVGK